MLQHVCAMSRLPGLLHLAAWHPASEDVCCAMLGFKDNVCNLCMYARCTRDVPARADCALASFRQQVMSALTPRRRACRARLHVCCSTPTLVRVVLDAVYLSMHMHHVCLAGTGMLESFTEDVLHARLSPPLPPVG
eukprot:351816-Chlamydomonas_euryale.AAC.4